jgi:hypothetical protein
MDDGMYEDVAGVLDPITKVLTGFMDSDDLLDRIDGIYNHLDTDASGGLNFEVRPSTPRPITAPERPPTSPQPPRLMHVLLLFRRGRREGGGRCCSMLSVDVPLSCPILASASAVILFRSLSACLSFLPF